MVPPGRHHSHRPAGHRFRMSRAHRTPLRPNEFRLPAKEPLVGYLVNRMFVKRRRPRHGRLKAGLPQARSPQKTGPPHRPGRDHEQRTASQAAHGSIARHGASRNSAVRHGALRQRLIYRRGPCMAGPASRNCGGCIAFGRIAPDGRRSLPVTHDFASSVE